MNEFQDAQFEASPSGIIIVDGQEVAHTKQCCHCQMHFVCRKGSGKIRGYCFDCKKITCGAPACNVHVPLGVKLNYLDGGNVSESALIRELNPFKDEIKFLTDKYGSVL